MTHIYIYTILGLSSSSAVSATINTQPVRIGPIAGGTRTFSSSGAGGSQPLTVRYDKNEFDMPKFELYISCSLQESNQTIQFINDVLVFLLPLLDHILVCH